MLRSVWFWLAVGVVMVIAVVTAVTLDPGLLVSSAAQRLGLSNQPDDEDERRRLVWLQARRDELVRVLKKRWPGVHMTSAYRSDAVNQAVGGAKSSRHRYGLALDFTAAGVTNYDDMARELRARAPELTVAPRDVLSETTPPHLHVDYYDPLGKLDGGAGPTAFKTEQGQTENTFARLA